MIGSLITNLNQVMVTIGNRDTAALRPADQAAPVRLRACPRTGRRSSGSLDSISALAVQTSDLVTGIRPGLTTDVKQLRSVAGNLDRNKAEIDRALQVLPIKLTKVGRTAIVRLVLQLLPVQLQGQRQAPGEAIKRSRSTTPANWREV